METVFKGTGKSPLGFSGCMHIQCYCDFFDSDFDDFYHQELERVMNPEA